MKFLILAIAFIVAPISMMNADDVKMQNHAYKEIHADQLKGWFDQGKTFVVVDARGDAYFDGNLLPNAKRLTSEASDAEIQAMLPNKDAIIVVYCSNVQCPAGGWLADRLVKMGYTNVYKYPEGIDDWMKKGYSTTKK